MIDSILLPILTGVISGIISSIIVTQSYRIKDRERDRVKYFEEVNAFYSKFKMQLLAIYDWDGIFKLTKIEMPKLYKWIHINQYEKAIIDKLDKIHAAVRHIVFEINDKIFKENQNRGNLSADEKNLILLNHSEDLFRYYKELEEMYSDVFCLEYPDAREILDEVMKEVDNLQSN